MTNIHGVQYLDTLGVAHGFINNAGAPQICAQPYLQALAEGDISGHAPWSKIGYNPSIATADEDLWSAGGLYGNGGLFPQVAAQWDIVGDENVEDIGDIIFGSRTVPITSDAGGSTTTLLDADVDFTAGTAAAAGDLLIVDPSGTTPEWGWITAVAAHQLTFAGGLSSGGIGTTRKYLVIDASTHKGSLAVKADYLDSTYAAKTMILPTNGTTAVTTLDDVGAAQTMLRVNSFRHIGIGTEAGTTGKSYGNWSLRTAGGGVGTIWSYITAGYNRARNTMYTVPLGKTLYVVSWFVGWATPNDTKIQAARFFTQANIEPATLFNTGNMFYTFSEVIVANSSVLLHFDMPTRLPAKTDLKVTGIAATAGSGPATSVLRGWLE